MAPKKTAEPRTRQSPARVPEEKESSDSDEEFVPSLNQLGAENPTFDAVIGPPARRGKSPATASASEAPTGSSTSDRDNFILEKQAQQEEQLRQLFNLVSSLGSEIRSIVKVVGESSSEERVDHKSGPTQKEKGKAASRSVSFDIQEDDEDENDENNDIEVRENLTDDFVSHGYYRDIIAEGFDKRSPSRLAVNKPAYFPIDDSVTRTLTASKYSAKAAEYSITVANAFFASVTRATLVDAITATNNGDPTTAAILLNQVSNNMSAIEDLHRDRMLFLDLTSDPNASATERDYANNILKNDFTPGVQNKGGSAKANKIFAAYQLQFLKATQFASAKATANRHLASSSGTGSGMGAAHGSGSGSQAANPSSNTQKKKKATAEKKNAAEKAAPGAAGQGRPRERKPQPEAED